MIATIVNLGTQRIFLGLFFLDNYFIALFFGTLFGLITKYVLYKNYIFYYNNPSKKNNSKMFTFYSFNGIFTTLIFWGTESFFYFVYSTSFARELGALIGLSIGYYIKYQLDKKFVFQN